MTNPIFKLNGRAISKERAEAIVVRTFDGQGFDDGEAQFRLAQERSMSGYIARDQIEELCSGLTIRHQGEEG